MTNEQRAARHILSHLIDQIALLDDDKLAEAGIDCAEQITQSTSGAFDAGAAFDLVKRYAAALSTDLGFAAEQNIPEVAPNLDHDHYTDRIYGWVTREFAERRRDHFYRNDDLEQLDNGRWIIVAR